MAVRWKKPKDEHIVYEALSAIVDKRFEMLSEFTTKCITSTGDKFYSLEYEPKTQSIMSNEYMTYFYSE